MRPIIDKIKRPTVALTEFCLVDITRDRNTVCPDASAVATLERDIICAGMWSEG